RSRRKIIISTDNDSDFGGGGKMKAEGPRQERETTINFNDEEDTAYVWTASSTIYRALTRKGYSPVEDCGRSASFEISKADIRLPIPKKKLTPEQSRARIKRLNSRKSALPVGKSQNRLARAHRGVDNRFSMTEIDQKQRKLRSARTRIAASA